MAAVSGLQYTNTAMPLAAPAPGIDPVVTVLLTTFTGLGLPRTLSIPVNASHTIHDLLRAIYDRLPSVDHALIITTTSNKQLLASSNEPISTLLSSPADTFLPLRLSARLCGGKGGFGSQLRAAGGRMSSRKNRNQQNTNGSNRNLDGRRLRTVDTAKRLADYLSTKDDLERKERKEQQEKWQKTIEDADRMEELIKSGKMGSGQGRLNAEYVESKELAEEKTREAVLKAMREGMVDMERTGSESSMEVDGETSEDEDAEDGSSGSSDDAKANEGTSAGPSFFGWDDEEDEDDEDEDEAEEEGDKPELAYEGKGKAKAT